MLSSHTREKNNTSCAYFKNPAYAYLAFVSWIMAYHGRAHASGATEAVSNVGCGIRLNMLRPRRASAIVLMYLVACIASAQADTDYHKVRMGDTLSKIAKAHGVSYRHLACLNDIDDPDRIAIGQRIALPRTGRKTQTLDLKWPINQGRMTSLFGPRRGTCHHGIDIAAPRGTAVRAADAGKVVFSGRQNGYGRVVILRHPEGYDTLYAHLQRIHVKLYQKVRRGQRIAKVGSSGRSTGPHLHFEVRENDKALDPMSFLPQKTRIVLYPGTPFGAGSGGK